LEDTLKSVEDSFNPGPERDTSIEHEVNTFAGEVLDRTDAPLMIKNDDMVIIAGTDEGLGHKINEDAVVINSEKLCFASIDGMGGMGKGEEAARILADALNQAFKEGEDITITQDKAHVEMKMADVGSGGACFLAARVQEGKLVIDQAGDVKLIIINKDGELTFQTTDEKDSVRRHCVTNCVQGTAPGKTTHSEIPINSGDRVIMASDGLWDMFATDKESIEAVQEILQKNNDPALAYKAIADLARRRMTLYLGKRDNINIILFDYMRDTEQSIPKDQPLEIALAENKYIRINRSNGAVDAGWKIIGKREDGRYEAFKPGVGSKKITSAEFVTLDKDRFEIKDSCKITLGLDDAILTVTGATDEERDPILTYPGGKLKLLPGKYTIGRSSENDITINIPTISKKHARLVVTLYDYWVEDLESTNGTRSEKI
jgi:serine/threonine protein phosphatase PrpC